MSKEDRLSSFLDVMNSIDEKKFVLLQDFDKRFSIILDHRKIIFKQLFPLSREAVKNNDPALKESISGISLKLRAEISSNFSHILVDIKQEREIEGQSSRLNVLMGE